MIKTVGVKNLRFHFYNDLLFLKFTAWISKRNERVSVPVLSKLYRNVA